MHEPLGGSYDGGPARSRQPTRFLVFGLIIALVVGSLTARLGYLQLVAGDSFTAGVAGNGTVSQAVPSTRGLIYDRNGTALVANVPAYVVKVIPADLPYSKREAVVQRLSTLLGIAVSDINATIDSSPGSRYDPVRIAPDVSEATARLIAEDSLSFPGVTVDVEARRSYTEGPILSQVLGYTGAVSAEQLAKLKEQGYLADDVVGKAGVESVYESQLRGSYGSETVRKDASGRTQEVVSTEKAAVPGNSLVLSIDMKEQAYAKEALDWALQKAGLREGAVIVMNPQTGEILAMVSEPTYDNNAFASGISSADYNTLLNDPNKPLLNHAIADQYPPGSTFKLVTGTAGLQSGTINSASTIVTKPYVSIGATKFWDWNHRGWGAINVQTGFAHSSDTFFYQLGQMVGLDKLTSMAVQYGFGTKTGIDLPGEASGIVPTDQWKMDTLGERMYAGEILQASIGQGYDTATPLQILNAYAALANGGKLYQPQVVREIRDADGNVVQQFQPKLIRTLDVSAQNLATMRLAARAVVTSRHTYNLADEPFVVAGKTGTAEFGTRDSSGLLPYHSWFVGFVPKNGDVSKPDSELAVIAFVYGSNTVGNISTEIVKGYLQLHFGTTKDLRRADLLKKGNKYAN